MDKLVFGELKGKPVKEWTPEEFETVLRHMQKHEPETFEKVRQIVQSVSESGSSLSNSATV